MAEYKNPLDGWLKELPEKAELSRRAWLEIKYTPAGEDEETDISFPCPTRTTSRMRQTM